MLITGHGDVSMAVAAMKAGAVDFLEKPFEADIFLAAVGAALSHPPSEYQSGGCRSVTSTPAEIDFARVRSV